MSFIDWWYTIIGQAGRQAGVQPHVKRPLTLVNPNPNPTNPTNMTNPDQPDQP